MAAFSLDAIREKLGYQPVLLGAVALLASMALSVAASSTHDPIAAAEAADMKASLAQVLPEGFADNDLLTDVKDIAGDDGAPVKVHVARQGGKAVGAVYQVIGKGYGGAIMILMAVDAQGTVLGVRVLKHTETPGLGDKIEFAKNPWIDSFKEKSLGNPPEDKWGVKKDGGIFDQFAGATITPRGVVKAVKGGLVFFREHRDEILAQ
jgi:Na+-translocating ferredoxin:NAD+ oxidoreductase subunit G